MRKDIPVCEFSIHTRADKRVAAEMVHVFDEKRMPLEMRIEPSIAAYLSRRFAPTFGSIVGYNVTRNREPLVSNFENLIDFTGGFSLIDDFWMTRTEDKTKNWDEYNLFTNEINEKISELAFTGEGTYNITEFVRSPEFTTDGNVDKAWRRIGGTTYLYKAGLSWKGKLATEQYSEFYAAQVAEKLDLRHVKYDLDVWKGQVCSVCELFTSEERSYISARSIFLNIGDYIRKLDRDSEQYQQLADILLFDALTINIRHLGNFGFLQDNSTLEIIGLAPIFDNGMALLGEFSDIDLTDFRCWSIYFMLSSRMYDRARPEEIKALLNERQRGLSKEMAGFKFKKHSKANMNDRRLNLLESIIQSRARFLSK